jgi:OOP family OmpA-OmpF porin
MKRITLAVVAALSCNLALAAEPGAYVSASVGSAEQKLSFDGLNITKSDTAFQIAGGYRFTPNVGAEFGYTNLGKAEISAQGMTASSKPQAIHLAVTGAWNVSPEFAVTGKLGAAHTRTKGEVRGGGSSESDTESRTSVTYGVGVSYTFAPNVAAIVEYQNFGKIAKDDGVDLKAHVVSAGVRYSF